MGLTLWYYLRGPQYAHEIIIMVVFGMCISHFGREEHF
jgi:hypothetical protein